MVVSHGYLVVCAVAVAVAAIVVTTAAAVAVIVPGGAHARTPSVAAPATGLHSSRACGSQPQSCPRCSRTGRIPLFRAHAGPSVGSGPSGASWAQGWLWAPDTSGLALARLSVAGMLEGETPITVSTGSVDVVRIAVSNYTWAGANPTPKFMTANAFGNVSFYSTTSQTDTSPTSEASLTPSGSNVPASFDMTASVGGAFITAAVDSGGATSGIFTIAGGPESAPAAPTAANVFKRALNVAGSMRSIGSLGMTLCWIREIDNAGTPVMLLGQMDVYPTLVETVDSLAGSVSLQNSQGYTAPGTVIIYHDASRCEVLTVTSRTGNLFFVSEPITWSKSGVAHAIAFPPSGDIGPFESQRTGLVSGDNTTGATMGVGRDFVWVMNNGGLTRIGRTSDSVNTVMVNNLPAGNGSAVAWTTTGADDVVAIAPAVGASDSSLYWYNDLDGTSGSVADAIQGNSGPGLAASASNAATAAGDPEVYPLIGPMYMMPHVVGAFRAFHYHTKRHTVVCNTTFTVEDGFSYHHHVYIICVHRYTDANTGNDEDVTLQAHLRFDTATGPPTVLRNDASMCAANSNGHVTCDLSVALHATDEHSGESAHNKRHTQPAPIVLATAHPRAITVALTDPAALESCGGYLFRRRAHNWAIPSTSYDMPTEAITNTTLTAWS